MCSYAVYSTAGYSTESPSDSTEISELSQSVDNDQLYEPHTDSEERGETTEDQSHGGNVNAFKHRVTAQRDSSDERNSDGSADGEENVVIKKVSRCSIA